LDNGADPDFDDSDGAVPDCDDSDGTVPDCDDSDGAIPDCGDSGLDWSDGPIPEGCEGGCDQVVSVSDCGVNIEVFIDVFCVDPMDCEAFRFLEFIDAFCVDPMDCEAFELDDKSVGVTTRPSDNSCRGILKSQQCSQCCRMRLNNSD
jgi:hypothetical protein